MKLIYQITFEYELSERDLMGDSPSQFIKTSMEDDPALLIDNSEIVDYKFKKSVKDETLNDEDEEDDDGLIELDEEELNLDD